ncbi:hypothetical protein [Thiomicrospira cyclica]|uniref:hypothetical protein n=1 Tax=Thiomicrospira cyclica TaxID=147268 RepID=UPI0002E6B01A|nr:hypothetical protein [Thiomicrospira cyclica]
MLNTIPKQNIFTLREEKLALLIWDSLRFIAWSRRNKIDATVNLELFSRLSAEFDKAETLKNKVDHPRCINFAGQLKLQKMPMLYTLSELM